MESIYPELALCGSKIQCARTDTVFLHLSEVSDGTVSLLLPARILSIILISSRGNGLKFASTFNHNTVII